MRVSSRIVISKKRDARYKAEDLHIHFSVRLRFVHCKDLELVTQKARPTACDAAERTLVEFAIFGNERTVSIGDLERQ